MGSSEFSHDQDPLRTLGWWSREGDRQLGNR